MTENKWTRLTKERWNENFLGKNKAEINRQYKMQYLVIPEDEWKDCTTIDGRITANMMRDEQKVVYRYHKLDHEKASFEHAVTLNPNVARNKNIFLMGYNYGKELN